MKIELFGHQNCPACLQLKDYFEKNNIDFDYINVWDNPEIANKRNVRSVPTVIIDGSHLVNPNINIIKDCCGVL